MKMNLKTILINLLFILWLQISNLLIIVNSLETIARHKYRAEFGVRKGTVVRVVISNDMHGLKKGNAGFVCAHGHKIWRKSKPGDRYVAVQFKFDGRSRFISTDCHIRSSFGFANIPININPDSTAYCYPSHVCGYSIRKQGVFYIPEKKLFPWNPLSRNR